MFLPQLIPSLESQPSLDKEELVDIALTQLQCACIQVVEWGALLFSCMNVPIMIKVC